MRTKSLILGLFSTMLLVLCSTLFAPANKSGPEKHMKAFVKINSITASLKADFTLATAPDIVKFERPFTGSVALPAAPTRKVSYYPSISAKNNSPPLA